MSIVIPLALIAAVACYAFGFFSALFLVAVLAAAAEPYHEPEPLPLCRNEDLPH